MATALCLSGCFSSEQPLIAPDTADTPLPDSATAQDFTNCAGSTGQLLGCRRSRTASSNWDRTIPRRRDEGEDHA